MKNWYDRILWKFSTCPYCGSLFRDPHFVFCTSCFQSLWRRRNLAQGFLLPATMGLPPFPIRSLFLWVQDEDVPLSLLLKMMKRGDQPESARVLMLGLASQLLLVGAWPTTTGCVLVPAPAKEGSMEDHAWVLAQQLAVWMPGAQVRSDLLQRSKDEMSGKKADPSALEQEKVPIREQKKKNRSAREKRGFQLTSAGREFLRKAPHQPIYFVDDILTTGSTAKAAWKALKKPSYFECLVVAYRKQPSLFDILRS